MITLNEYIIEKLKINKVVHFNKETFEPANEIRDFVKKILIDDLGVHESDIIMINVIPASIYVKLMKDQYLEGDVGCMCEKVVDEIKEKYKLKIFGIYEANIFQINIDFADNEAD